MRVLELADKVRQRVRESGLPIQVIEVAGWQTRGNEFPIRPDGALRHWTAAGGTGRTTCLGAVTYGRTSPTPLAGPLCELYQSRNLDGYDDIYIIASGKANHAGEGEWNGIKPGNYQVLGLEIEWAGPTEAFPAKRKLVSEIAMRALMDCVSGTDDNDACEHREWALPRGRKIDTNLDGNELRRRMAEMRNGVSSNPTKGDDDLDIIVRGDASGEWWITDGKEKEYVDSVDIAGGLVWIGLARWDDTLKGPIKVGQAWIDSIPQVATRVGLETGLANLNKALTASINGLVDKIVSALPPGSGGGVTKEDVQAAATAAIEASGLTTLLPGK